MKNEKNTIWQEIFADYRKSNLSQRAYCKANNLKYSTFAYWRNRLSKRAKEQFVDVITEVKLPIFSEVIFPVFRYIKSIKFNLSNLYSFFHSV